MIPLLLLVAIAGLMQAARSFSSGLAAGGTELAFGYLLLVAYFTGKIVDRFGLPKLTGYLIAGIVSGPFVLALVTHDMTSSLKVVNGAATSILGLTGGLELNFKRIRPLMATVRAITVYAVIGAMFVLSATMFALHWMIPFFDPMPMSQVLVVCLVLGITLAAQSPAVVMALLSEMRSDGPLSQTLLACVVVSDLAVIICYSIAAALASAVIGGGVDVTATILEIVWELFGSMAFGIAIGMVIAVYLRRVKRSAALFALMLCVVGAEIGGRVHLDPLVVMLAAGVWLENFSKAPASELLHELEGAQLPVFLVFFAMAGVGLDLGQLVAYAIPVGVLCVARAGWFYYGARYACRRVGSPETVQRSGWVGLVPQAGLALALALVMRSAFPTFGPGASVIILGIIAVNQLIPPIALRIALVRSGEVGKKQTGEFHA